MKPHLFPIGRVIAATAVLAFLAGCTTFSRDGGFDSVATAASQRPGKGAVLGRTDEDRNAVAKRTQELLSRPLGMDGAIQIALLNNRGLQASYSELGIAEADLVQAGRLPNPGFCRPSPWPRRHFHPLRREPHPQTLQFNALVSPPNFLHASRPPLFG